MTALDYAAKNGHLELVKYLIEVRGVVGKVEVSK